MSVADSGVLLVCVAPAGVTGFSLLRNPDEFLGNIDSMDTNDGKEWYHIHSVCVCLSVCVIGLWCLLKTNQTAVFMP